jgi:[ribosomal protein S5]-alanine N-acetyltransferase
VIKQGDAALAKYLGIVVKPNWSENGVQVFDWTEKALTLRPEVAHWYTYLPIYKTENTVVGTCGYLSPPKDGIVEIGYEVSEAYRSRGLATELAQLLTLNALKNKEIKMVTAHTIAEINHSSRILLKLGYERTREFMSEEDGMVWRWERKRTWIELIFGIK